MDKTFIQRSVLRAWNWLRPSSRTPAPAAAPPPYKLPDHALPASEPEDPFVNDVHEYPGLCVVFRRKVSDDHRPSK